MSLVDLKMTKQEMKEETSPSPADQNPYPWGARISLDTDELAKLGITADNLPKVGDEIHVTAVGTITTVSEDETAGNGYRCSVQIQLEQMALENEGQEAVDDADSEAGEAAEAGAVHGTRTVMHSTYRGR